MSKTRLISRIPPFARFEQEGPARPGGAYVFDVVWKDRHVVVQFSPRHGYGVSASEEMGLGVGPDEIYESEEEAARRVVELLETGADTCPLPLRG